MPYSSISELPDAVRSRYSPRCQRVFMEAFNAHDGDETSRFKVAHTAATNCRESGKAMTPLKATLLDDDKFSLRIIPFGGLITGPDGKGRDADLEYFSPRTNIYPDYFTTRPVLWHHGKDGLMKGDRLGHSDNLHMEEDGWWEDVWIRHGERKAELVKRLSQRAGIYGSSGPLHEHLIVKARDGEIRAWPHAETTLSTSPQNFLAIPRAAKAVLDDFDEAGLDVPSTIRDLLPHLDVLRDPDPTPRGDGPAKAGRELSGLAELEEWLDTLKGVTGRAETLIRRVREKYTND